MPPIFFTRIPDSAAALPVTFNDPLQQLDNALTDNVGPVFNVKGHSYGATGLGVADDRAAIQAAIEAAITAGGGDIYLPRGRYYIGSWHPSGGAGAFRYSLSVGDWGTVPTIRFVGDHATITTDLTNGTDGAALINWIGSTRPLIAGITFENTALVGNRGGYTAALYMSGGASNVITEAVIEHCRFRNFSRSIVLAGTRTAWVRKNRFEYDDGRDSASSDLGQPCVSIWASVGATGQSSDTFVQDNDFDGCLSTDVSGNTNKMGADGLVFGYSRGWTITGNRIRRNSYEGIFVWHRQAYEATRFPVVIAGNTIDATPVTGETGQGSWGIRCDEHDAVIKGNVLKACMNGIWVYGFAAGVTAQIENPVIQGNEIWMADSAQNSGAGIYVGYVNNLNLQGNTVIWGTSAALATVRGVSLGQVTKGVVRGNVVRVGTQPVGQTMNGFEISECTGLDFAGNVTDNCDNAFSLVTDHSTMTVWSHTFITCAVAFDGNLNNLTDAIRYWGTAAPVAGDWRRGNIVWNTQPSGGGAPGWMCVTAGSPGTWKAMANLAA